LVAPAAWLDAVVPKALGTVTEFDMDSCARTQMATASELKINV
jgi:hypothetical protein